MPPGWKPEWPKGLVPPVPTQWLPPWWASVCSLRRSSNSLWSASRSRSSSAAASSRRSSSLSPGIVSGSESQSQTSSSISTGVSMPLNMAANAWSYWSKYASLLTRMLRATA